MIDLIEGRIVHYMYQWPEHNKPMLYAAIVSRVHGDSDVKGIVNLHVFMEEGVVVKCHVPYDWDRVRQHAEYLPGTWHWPNE